MARRSLSTCLLTFSLALAGCPSTHAGDLDGGTDASVIDAPAIDGGRDTALVDTPAPSTPLSDALSCGFTASEALSAIVRHVACLDRRENASVGGFYEAWEAGLFSGLDVGFTSFEPGLGCEAWRCIAAASSCGEVSTCLAPCEDVAPSCDGSVRTECSGGLPRRLDCGALGMTCASEGCVLGECIVTASAVYQLSCDAGDVTLCEGAVRAPCAGGTECASFAIGGEVPTVFCSPGGASVAGAYGNPISCRDGVIEAGGFLGAPFRFDCRANGYGGCDEWGCLP